MFDDRHRLGHALAIALLALVGCDDDRAPGDRADDLGRAADAGAAGPDAGATDAMMLDASALDAMTSADMAPDGKTPDGIAPDAEPWDTMAPEDMAWDSTVVDMAWDAMDSDAGALDPIDAAVPDVGCTPPTPWTRARTRAGGVVVFTEVLADPLGDGDAEWVELFNTLALPVDLSGWRLDDAVRFTFPPGSLIGPGERIIVTRDPATMGALDGVQVFGPFDGRLARDGERIELLNQVGRRMDTMRWVAGPPWPVPPRDSGISLIKPVPEAESDRAEHWTLGPLGGTPGRADIGAPDLDPPPRVLVPPDTMWGTFDGIEPDAAWLDGAGADDAALIAPVSAGPPPSGRVTVHFTADNHFAAYVGPGSGEGLRLLGRDTQGDWQSAEIFDGPVDPGDHLFVAAWEAPGDARSPQMLVGTWSVDGAPPRGSSIETLQTVLGPPDANPGGPAPAAAPDPVALEAVVRAADAADAWRPPAVERAADQPPWSGALRAIFGDVARYVWLDTFAPDAVTNQQETYALFRSVAPLLGPPSGTTLDDAPGVLWLRTAFAVDDAVDDGDLVLDLAVDDGAVVWINGVEVLRHNAPPGPVTAETRAVDPVDRARAVSVPVDAAVLRPGANTIAVAILQAAAPDDDLYFAAGLRFAPAPPLPLAAADDGDGPVVINELMYHPRPPRDVPEPPDREWLELYNRSAGPVDLDGWSLVDGVAYAFPPGTVIEPGEHLVVAADPAAFAALWPDVPALGPWDGGLSNRGDRVRLLDACGEPIDDVRYFDGGRWPDDADGWGASLELRDARADNASPDAWSASDEAGRVGWQRVEYRGVAGRSVVGPDGQWHELVLGLLDAGVVLLDDVSVIEDPDGLAIERIADGGFDGGAAAWRLVGTHGRSTVVPDPDDPDNPVLRLEATGPAEHMHNHAETTLLDGAPIDPDATYAIAFRARWVSGSNQLNSRLYFNRLARTTLLETSPAGGTPGAPNSTMIETLGPTFTAGGHAPPVPRPDTPIRVAVTAHDPDGIEQAVLWWAEDGAPFASTPMTSTDGMRYEAQLPGHPAGALLHIWVEATDARGHTMAWPAGGAAGRALIQVDDGRARAATAGLPMVRILMTAADRDRLMAPTELMSNARIPVTVVVDERRVYRGVGVRGKGSQRGRPSTARYGYSLRFDPADLFRGVYPSVSLDRSEGTRTGQRELLMDVVMTAAGAPSAEYNDLAHVVAPTPAHDGPVTLQLARFGGLLLDNAFADGGDGTVFEYELVYYPLTTDDGTPTGRKRPQPDRVVGTPIRDLGDDPEAWRHVMTIKSNRRQDDFSGIMAFGQVFGLPDDLFRTHAPDVIDVDQWLQAFALSTLSGTVDQYAAGSQHNVQFYVRPEDGRVLFFPHDLDFWRGDPRGPVVANGDLRRLLAEPAWRRGFYRHLHRLLETVYNDAYMAPWRDRLAPLLPAQDFAGHHAFLVARARYVRDEAPDGITASVPPVPFALTAPAPRDAVPAGPLLIEGTAWLDVAAIRRVGADAPLALRWVSADTWQAEIEVMPDDEAVAIEALDDAGRPIARSDVQVVVGP